MKCSELQIGDWVKIDYNNQKVKVTAVYNNWIDTSSISPLMSKVSPIPLTPEILELNGFLHYEDFGYSLVTTDDKSFLLLGVFSGGTYLWHEVKIYYVHELQHALRLCGLNELADNFKVEE